MTGEFDLVKSKPCHVVSLCNNRGQRPSLNSLLSLLLLWKESLQNSSISLKFMVCNRFSAFSACSFVIITELARYTKQIDVGILW